VSYPRRKSDHSPWRDSSCLSVEHSSEQVLRPVEVVKVDPHCAHSTVRSTASDARLHSVEQYLWDTPVLSKVAPHVGQRASPKYPGVWLLCWPPHVEVQYLALAWCVVNAASQNAHVLSYVVRLRSREW